MYPVVPPAKLQCSKCHGCVEISIDADETDISFPKFESDCCDVECPINKENQPNAIQSVAIYFVSQS